MSRKKHKHSAQHIHKRIPACIVPKLDWLGGCRGSAQRNLTHHTTALLDLAAFVCHLVWGEDELNCSPGTRGSEWGLRGQISAVGRVNVVPSFTPSFQSLEHPVLVTLPTMIWEHQNGVFYLHIPLRALQSAALFHMLMSPEITHTL